MSENNSMEEANKTLIRALFEEALQQENLAIIERIFSPAFIDHSTPDQSPGTAGVKEYFLAVRNGFPDLQVTLEDMIADGNKVVVRTTWRGTHLGTYEGVPPTGKQVTRTLIQIFRVVDGRIVEEWNEGAGLLS